jgi:hypothetical protein
MSDPIIFTLVAFGFFWGYATARVRDYGERMDDEKRNREAVRDAYLRHRRVRLDHDEWGDNAGA